MDISYFDQPFVRKGTNCLKWDALEAAYGNADAIPMWVADMDLPIAPAIAQALTFRTQHPAYGYFRQDPSEIDAFRQWMLTRHDWNVEEASIEWMPSVLTTVRLGVELFSKPGEKVMIMPPVYPPFWSIPRAMGRELVLCPLLETESGWKMDFDKAESLLKEGCKAIILCSPHNPVGRVWTREELETLVQLFARYDAKIIADEIHSDLIMPGYRHTSMLTVKGAEERTLVGISGTKTFNLAGLEVSAAILPPFVRENFRKLKSYWGYTGGNQLAHTAQTAAYRFGAQWVDALLCYLDENRRLLEEELEKDFPGVKMSRLEGTYLAWLDFRATNVPPEELVQRAVKAGVAPGKGKEFGAPGCLRYNLACPHWQLQESLKRLQTIL